MSIVQVSVWEGLTPENKKKIVEDLTKVLEDIGVPKEEIKIVIYEAPKSNWATGGELHSEKYTDSPSLERKIESVDESTTSKMVDIVTSVSMSNSISKPSLQNEEFGEAVFRAEKMKTHTAEESKTVSETVILESERGTKLYQDRFIHQGKLYPISEIKQASIKAGFIHALLEILFKDGKIMSFYVGIEPNMTINNTFSNDFKNAAEQWASAINALIALSSK